MEGLNNTEVYFAVSEKGWTNNKLGLQWLEKVFDKCTKAKVGVKGRAGFTQKSVRSVASQGGF